MSWIYIILLGTAAFLVSVIGAVFSIMGLTSLFAGATLSVGIMAASLEFAKLVSAGFLYRYWGHVNPVMRTYLSAAVVVLSVITSMGIFGYLSNAYQRSSLELNSMRLDMESLRRKEMLVQTEIQKIEKFIGEIPSSRISKKFALYNESRGHVTQLTEQSKVLNTEMEELRRKMLNMETEVGPIIFVAEMVDVPVDAVAKFLILVFVSVFDPLAICLVFAMNLAIRIREKYRGNEVRIGNLSLTKPVDHRYRKSA